MSFAVLLSVGTLLFEGGWSK